MNADTQKQINTIGYLLQHVSAVLHRQSDQMLQERLGIGMSQFKILMMLQRQPNVKQRVLAHALGQTEASISRQVKLLHEKGMLALRVDPDERRKHIAVLTPKGTTLAEAARQCLAEYHAPMFEELGEKQRKQLQEILAKLHEYACAPGRPGCCDHPFDTPATNNQKEQPK